MSIGMSLPGCSNIRGRWSWRSQSKQCSWAWYRVTGWGQRHPDEGRLLGHRGQETCGGLAVPSQDTILRPLQLMDSLSLHFSLQFALSTPHLSFFLFLFFPLSFSLCLLSGPTLRRYPAVSRVTQPRGNRANFCSHLYSLLAYSFYVFNANYNSCFKILVC